MTELRFTKVSLVSEPFKVCMNWLLMGLYSSMTVIALNHQADGFQKSTRGAAMFRGGPERSGVIKTEGVDRPGKLKWTFQTNGVVRSSPTIREKAIYFGSGDGRLYSLNRNTGRSLWSYDARSPVDSSPAVSSEIVVFADRSGVVTALNAATGRIRWKLNTGERMPFEWGYEGWDYYSSSPAIVGTSVFVGSSDGKVYSINARTGAKQWSFQTGGRILSSPAISDGTVYCGSADGSLYAIDQTTGQLRWRFDTAGTSLRSETFGYDRRSIQASPAVVDGVVYIGSRDGTFYAVDAETGTLEWRSESGTSWVVSSAAVDGDLVFSGRSDQHYVNALRSDTGEEVWRFSVPSNSPVFSSPVVVANTVYVGCAGGSLYAINKTTGALRWQFQVGGAIYSSPAVDDGVVYFASDTGALYALEGAADASPLRAVFWDKEFTTWQAIQPNHEEIRRYFESWGYQVLNAETLATFMEGRIGNKTPSVIVFAMDLLPSTVAQQTSVETTFRRYLDNGGKVVWLGNPPSLFARDQTGKVTKLDRNSSGKLLGVSHDRVNFDVRGITNTAEGKRWGMKGWWTGGTGVDPTQVTMPLAIDDTGQAAAWVKNYGGSLGTGFVQLWGPQTRLDREYLEMARAVAEFGILRPTGL